MYELIIICYIQQFSYVQYHTHSLHKEKYHVIQMKARRENKTRINKILITSTNKS